MIKKILTTLVVGLLIVSCGYKGSLYLPQSKTKSSASTTNVITKKSSSQIISSQAIKSDISTNKLVESTIAK